MSETLLPGKLDRPVPRPDLLPRHHLKARLDGAVGRRLLLVTAAAGYGKTSLVADWCAQRPEPVAWYSLDSGDNDPNRFLRYLLAAIRQALPTIGADLPIALRTLPPPGPETVIRNLLPQLASLPGPCLIVLDDYHLIANETIHQAVHLLLSHLPQSVTLLLLSRADPPFPLGRWRANGEVLELRAADLGFQPAELAYFFAETALSPDQLNQLQQRTEGWPAGLQLAALALQNAPDPAAFVAEFSGSNRFVLDYLLEEVLQGLPSDLRQFLLATAWLPQFNAPLCDAALARDNSASLLRELERRNLFLIPLDQRRDWYRYHHLFADLLQAQLPPGDGTRHQAMHKRAAAWLAAHDRPETAVYHALRAAAYDEAARLITGPALAASARSEVLTLRRWHEAFPADYLRQNPLLALHFGVNFALNGRWPEAEELLGQIEAARTQLPMGSYLLWRYLMSHQLAPAPDWQDLLDNAAVAAAKDPLAAMVLGLLLGMRGEAVAALGWLEKAINLGTTLGSELAVTARIHRCRLLVQAGDYRSAWALGQTLLQELPNEQPLTQLIRLTLGQIALEWLELDIASTHLTAVLAQAQRTGLLAGSLSGARLLLAEVAAARGDVNLARDHLVAGLAAAHKYDSATEAAWAKLFGWRLGLTIVELPDTPPDPAQLLPSRFFPPRFSQLGAAWYWLRRNRPVQAMPILAEILAGPEDGATLDAYCHLALLRQLQGDPGSAQIALTQALQLGHRAGRLRPFLRLGQPLQELLQQLPLAPATASFQQELLSRFATSSGATSQVALTEREMEVLRLISAGCTNQEIASALVVAHSTVKWYVNSLYRKLAVKSRVQALTRARELGIIG